MDTLEQTVFEGRRDCCQNKFHGFCILFIHDNCIGGLKRIINGLYHYHSKGKSIMKKRVLKFL